MAVWVKALLWSSPLLSKATEAGRDKRDKASQQKHAQLQVTKKTESSTNAATARTRLQRFFIVSGCALDGLVSFLLFYGLFLTLCGRVGGCTAVFTASVAILDAISIAWESRASEFQIVPLPLVVWRTSHLLTWISLITTKMFVGIRADFVDAMEMRRVRLVNVGGGASIGMATFFTDAACRVGAL